MKQPLFYISGWANDGSEFHSVAEQISRRFDVTILTLAELEKRAVTPTNDKNDSPSAYARALIHLAANSQPVITGFSTGGMVALEACLAVRSLARSLVLISSCARFTQAEDGYQGVPVASLRAMRRGLPLAPERTLKQFFSLAARAPITPDNLDQKCATALGMGVDSLLRGLVYLEATDLRLRLNQLSTKTMILHGAADAIIPFACAEYLNHHIPGSTLRRFEGIGHGGIDSQSRAETILECLS